MLRGHAAAAEMQKRLLVAEGPRVESSFADAVALITMVDEVWLYRPRDSGEKLWGVHLTCAAALTGTLFTFILYKRLRALAAATSAAPQEDEEVAGSAPAS